MLDTLLETLKKQRMAWSWAVIIGLFLVVVGHAPVVPVIAGCLLAVGFSVLRAWPHQTAEIPVRELRVSVARPPDHENLMSRADAIDRGGGRSHESGDHGPSSSSKSCDHDFEGRNPV